MIRRWIPLLSLCLIGACGKSGGSGSPKDASTDQATDASLTSPCIDQPTNLPRPPTEGRLPCDMLPPGFK